MDGLYQRTQSLPAYQAIGQRQLHALTQHMGIPKAQRIEMRAVASVFPFRTNSYILNDLIDWDAIPDDPIYQLVFPQPGMLAPHDLQRMVALLNAEAPDRDIQQAAHEIRLGLNPHPAGQLDLNVPTFQGRPLRGLQHKYRETVLFFPSHGQTCHAYCTYCFRWPQFIGEPSLKIAMREATSLNAYLLVHPEVTDVLVTGGDPLIMRTAQLERYIDALLDPALDTLQTIRIGTKSLSYWPYRFVTDPDADDLLRLFERVVQAGKHLAIMAHYTHPHELRTPIAREALRRVQQTGAIIRSQAPVVHHINDSAAVWAELWRISVREGIVPYYMFVERDTGPKNYFEVPLARTYDIFRDAYASSSGLAHTVRGPTMSTTPGKVLITGITEVCGEQVFVLQFIQARDPDWIGRPFFARFDPKATWMSDLQPAFGEDSFFYEKAMDVLQHPFTRSHKRQ